MKKIEQFQNIKLDIQAENFDPENYILSRVRHELKKLMRLYGNIVGADVYLQQEGIVGQEHKMARIRVGVPGRDLIAEAISSNWLEAISEVGAKLRNQIQNR
ncbi:HPF/RaiA family ribosome-associated protein [Arundinibacter roseus]|uniref:HPF/RaiA family ribosome-associated protein n=1 Tax=Arundinibacter roseus TaxID=2070510 RepID=A0A4R4KIS4_9BACT|nr:HPF/RaiA family ribosome-associated protein [Arundinibacter roseus]TDB68068.1 hypothetical protein EZE20_03870 [Arundinibacter roseus]